MITLGIDPGSVVCGYGAIKKEGSSLFLVEYGVIEAKKIKNSFPERLGEIFERISNVIERTAPDCAVFESTFYSKNPQSLIKLSHARGAAMAATSLKQIPIDEFSPKEIKKAVTGNGAASKEQVQFMVKTLLSIKETPDFFDATDALAAAICGSLKSSLSSAKAKSWKDFIEKNPDRIVKS